MMSWRGLVNGNNSAKRTVMKSLPLYSEFHFFQFPRPPSKKKKSFKKQKKSETKHFRTVITVPSPAVFKHFVKHFHEFFNF